MGWQFRVEAENGVISAMADAALNLGNSLHPVINVKFLEDALHMVFYGEGTDRQNTAYLPIGFAHLYPIHSRSLNPWSPFSSESAARDGLCGRRATPRNAVSR